MTSFPSTCSDQNGFSLLEIIITLVVAAFFGTLFIQYMGTSLTKSAEPLIGVQRAYEAAEIIERMTADYKKLLIMDNDPLTTFENWIENGNNPDISPYYGDYTAQTGFIRFDGQGKETPDDSEENRILKVSITSHNQILTALFTK